MAGDDLFSNSPADGRDLPLKIANPGLPCVGMDNRPYSLVIYPEVTIRKPVGFKLFSDQKLSGYPEFLILCIA